MSDNDIKLDNNSNNDFFSQFNSKNNIFDVDTSKFDFISVSDLYKEVKDNPVKVDGFYINSNGKFGAEPEAILTDYHKVLNLPRHLLDSVNSMLDNDRAVELIKAGKLGMILKPYYTKKYNKNSFTCVWTTL